MRDDLTEADVEAGKSPKGGWTRATLESWGVPWPPPAGWKDALTAKSRAAIKEARQIKAPGPSGGYRRATLISDASWSDRTRLGAWAAWIKNGPRPGELFSGVFKEPAGSSHECEAMAIANGIALAGHAGLLADVDVLMIQSDAIDVLAKLVAYVESTTINDAKEGSAPVLVAANPRPLSTCKPGVVAAVNRIQKLVVQHAIRLEVRHVKGHAAYRTSAHGRHRINDLCDKTARALREQAERAANLDKRAAARARKKARRAERKAAAEATASQETCS